MISIILVWCIWFHDGHKGKEILCFANNQRPTTNVNTRGNSRQGKHRIYRMKHVVFMISVPWLSCIRFYIFACNFFALPRTNVNPCGWV